MAETDDVITIVDRPVRDCGRSSGRVVDPRWAQAALDEVRTRIDWSRYHEVERLLFSALEERPFFAWSCGQVRLLEGWLARVRGGG